MSKWMVFSKKADFDSIASKFHIDKVIARIIRNRDIESDKDIDMFLNGTMDDLHDPLLMKDMVKACKIINKYITDKKHIRIIGDYDVDGISATYILLKGLRTLGAMVDTVIPHRTKDGYGLNDNLVNEAHEENVDLIVTCDNGIAASAQIDLAKEYGMEVVITDHHEVPYTEEAGKCTYIVPKAGAVVDPKQSDCPYPFKSICGAMVAYKLISVLFNNEYDDVLTQLLPFAALATVCDVMELKDENRIVVKNGLKLMESSENFGLKALITVCGLSDKAISNYHAGFIIGPCLNATGRLDTAKRALSLFDAPSYKDALTMATELKELNEARKKLTEDGVKDGTCLIENSTLKDDKVLVIYMPQVHESLAGIIAGRIKEKYNKPTLVITRAEDGLKGSGRSIEEYDMYKELNKVSFLFTKFGGHKMAAGISLNSEEELNKLRCLLNENTVLTPDDLQKKVHIDVPMPLSYINYDFVQSLNILEPFGTGNPKPVFATRNISLLSYAIMGKNRNVIKCRILDEDGRGFEMIHFGPTEDFEEFIISNFGKDKLIDLQKERLSKGDIMISMVYYPEINEFRGMKNLQIVMNYYDV